MNELFIYHYRENDGDGEEVIMSETLWDEQEIADNCRPKFHLHQIIDCDVNKGDIYALPLDFTLVKE